MRQTSQFLPLRSDSVLAVVGPEACLRIETGCDGRARVGHCAGNGPLMMTSQSRNVSPLLRVVTGTVLSSDVCTATQIFGCVAY
jgi:hypothetical protein